MATKYVLNKGSMRNNIGMDFLREIYCILAMNNINIVAKYLTSKYNIVLMRCPDLTMKILLWQQLQFYWNIMTLFYIYVLIGLHMYLTNVFNIFCRLYLYSAKIFVRRCLILDNRFCQINQSYLQKPFEKFSVFLSLFWI